MEVHVEPALTLPHDSEVFAYARRLRQEADFELLKTRMLLRAMDEFPAVELHIHLFRAAAEAANLTLRTPFPLLGLPGLFEEKADVALKPVCQSSLTIGG